MTSDRFLELSSAYGRLRIAILGDFCLDRYLEIDPSRAETSIETGRPVHNVTHVRHQPGAAGTVLNNLAALGIGEIIPLGFRGEDAEGHELQSALQLRAGVNLDHFLTTTERRTFTYCKPLLMYPDRAPEELNRLDFKNWTPTPRPVAERIANALAAVFSSIDALIVLNQVDERNTGVITAPVLEMLRELMNNRPEIPVLGDSRTGFPGWPAMSLKMNASEARRLIGSAESASPDALADWLARQAAETGRPSFITMAEDGILSAGPDGSHQCSPALPVRGEIDIVGAGDCVTANLAAALAAGAGAPEAADIANLAASLAIHQLGTTGTADVPGISQLLAS